MAEWCQANKLSIHFAKTKYMTIKHNKVANEPDLKLKESKITTVYHYEYL